MANEIIRPSDLTPRSNPVASEVVPSDNGSTVAGVTWANGVNAGRPLASQGEAEAGVQATKAMTPLTTKQAIDAQVPAIVGGAISGLATVATTGDYSDLDGTPTLGSMAAENTGNWTPISRAMPMGGTSNQVLAKASGTDYDVSWVDPTGGGGGVPDDGSVTLAKLDPALSMTVPVLSKETLFRPVIVKTGVDTASIRAGTAVKVGGVVVSFSTDTAITMPTLVAGTDYAVFVGSDGSAQAVAWTEDTGTDPTPPVGEWTWIGGFHFAPGANATGYSTGGNRTPTLNEYSIWDLRFRPKCPDPRGMALMAGKFWFDIYFLGVDHHLNGTSRMGVDIATGDVKPKLPAMFGGDGTTLVTHFDWFWTYEILDSHAKRMMTLNEFRSAAFGVIEMSAGGRETPAVKTGINFDNDGLGTNNDERYTSMWGMNLSIANHYIWGQDLVGHTYTGTYTITTAQAAPTVRPNYYQDYTGRARGWSPQLGMPYIRAGLFGGSTGSNMIGRSGSGSMDWANSVNSESLSIGARGAADHLII